MRQSAAGRARWPGGRQLRPARVGCDAHGSDPGGGGGGRCAELPLEPRARSGWAPARAVATSRARGSAVPADAAPGVGGRTSAALAADGQAPGVSTPAPCGSPRRGMGASRIAARTSASLIFPRGLRVPGLHRGAGLRRSDGTRTGAGHAPDGADHRQRVPPPGAGADGLSQRGRLFHSSVEAPFSKRCSASSSRIITSPLVARTRMSSRSSGSVRSSAPSAALQEDPLRALRFVRRHRALTRDWIDRLPQRPAGFAEVR